ncbi:MAG: polyprenyl synthetase family protein [Polyangiaceae bacterium]
MPREFESFVDHVRAQVERGLCTWLEVRVTEARARGADIGRVADAVRQLTLRGGKRLRPALLAAAYEACSGEGGSAPVTLAGMALELLQTYLLAHDDWMDGDALRRGGPSLPAMMRASFSGAQADAMSVLAGDLASAWSHRALFEMALPPDRVLLASREFARVEEDVVEGQVLDVLGCSGDGPAVETMHSLKTASYTVRGPLTMGARLAGASDAQVSSLEAFGEPLGIAFQLRDDVLGVFGQVGATGKPAGNDLRAGKRSAVTVDALAAGLSADLVPVLGRASASDDDVQRVVQRLEARGVRARIEARIEVLVRDAHAALERASLTATGRALLADAIHILTQRRN